MPSGGSSDDTRAMPELPDIAINLEALARRVLGAEVTGVRVAGGSCSMPSIRPKVATADQ